MGRFNRRWLLTFHGPRDAGPLLATTLQCNRFFRGEAVGVGAMSLSDARALIAQGLRDDNSERFERIGRPAWLIGKVASYRSWQESGCMQSNCDGRDGDEIVSFFRV